MQQPPERTLTLLVLAVLIISVLGILFSIISIGTLTRTVQEEIPTTGYLSSDVGNVSIIVFGSLSITTEDSAIIDFGGCSAGGIIYSNETGGSNTSHCQGYTPGSLIIRNDGDSMANVTFNMSNWGEAHGGTFLNSTTNDSWIAYKVSNTTTNINYTGGCNGFFETDWTNITDGSQRRACDLLGANGVSNSFSFDIAMYVPPTTQNGNTTLSIDFLAKLSS